MKEKWKIRGLRKSSFTAAKEERYRRAPEMVGGRSGKEREGGSDVERDGEGRDTWGI